MAAKRSRRESASSPEDPSSPFSREHSADIKIALLDPRSAVSEQPVVMRCSLPPHEPLTFSSFDEYDVHYHKTHMHRCSECQGNFPDDHFLNLHIAEYHDPIKASLREKGEKTYACLLPDCDRVCSSPQKRRLHCIDKHLFPRDYDFYVIKGGIDRRSSMLRPANRRKSSAFNSTGSATDSTRQRGDSNVSADGESMEIVKDEAEKSKEHEYEHEHEHEHEKVASSSRRTSLQLRGRGGFGRVGGFGRERGRGALKVDGVAAAQSPAQVAPADPVDALTSGMSALHFVPHSVSAARARDGAGRGRGG